MMRLAIIDARLEISFLTDYGIASLIPSALAEIDKFLNELFSYEFDYIPGMIG